jgi:hypothetical protein
MNEWLEVFSAGMATGGFLVLLIVLAEAEYLEWRKKRRDRS